MILTDSSVVIDFLRTADPKIRQLIVSQSAAVCGITRAEVLHGSRNATERQGLLTALNLFQQMSMADSLWDHVGDNLASLRAAGVSVPFADVIIATLGIDQNLELWTRDNQFAMIQKVLPALKLFQEPP